MSLADRSLKAAPLRDRYMPLSDLKVSLHRVVATLAEVEEIVLLRYGKPAAVLLSVDRYQTLMDRLAELEAAYRESR